MVGKYCCFSCPKENYSLHELEDLCPTCGKPYGFPLTDAPKTIGDRYFDLKPLDRGFYSATYEARAGSLARPVVLKVIPVDVYSYFKKDFNEECRIHQEVAEDTEHLVKIMEAFDYKIDFNGETIPCHVAELQFISGVPLSEFLEKPENCTAPAIAQITIDLFRLMSELENKKKFHNDLHNRNIVIQQLSAESRRADAIEERIRAVAIDLGSVSDSSKTDPAQERLGDLSEIVSHLLSFRERLLFNPSEVSDEDYRLASLLDDIAHTLSPDAVTQRTPDFADIIQQIEDGYQYLTSPWRQPGGFKRFDDSYNAQTLHPWFVPRLLVDPDYQWTDAVSKPGPQVITGIRGCGKTMLLRALQFHARVWTQEVRAGENGITSDEILNNLEREGFVGLYVSCNRLLEGLGDPSRPLHEPFTKLYLEYAREALRAVRHLRQISDVSVSRMYWQIIGEAVQDYVQGVEALNNIKSDAGLERKLSSFIISLDRGQDLYRLTVSPVKVFTHLAEAVRKCSRIWNTASVLFLLDDVSTRHLAKKNIAELLGTLLFSNPLCAFKMTTEVQTLEQLLRSPGLIEKARPGRDYQTFDLGAEVNKRLRGHNGPEFIAEILQQRAKEFPNHPHHTPKQLLGDESLESIARRIARTDKTSRERKEIYHGLRALSALCVGDIGDVISLYEDMLRHYRGAPPIPARIQSECFQDYCSRRLYHLNRQGSRLKDFALAFAEASHELLIKSAQQAKAGGRKRLRQYSNIYIQLTAGKTDKQFEIIRDLTDKGIFVLEGGSDTPRAKTRHSNPTQQFILTYRKLFGLSNFIGLAESDRFELKGQALQDWLNNPSKAILIRNLGSPLPPKRKTIDKEPASPKQLTLIRTEQAETPADEPTTKTIPLPDRLPMVQALKPVTLSKMSIDTLILGLGFEQRTLDSAARILDTVKPHQAILIKYQEKGYAKEIEKLVSERVERIKKVDYLKFSGSASELCEGETLVDVTGLVKQVIFSCVLHGLTRSNQVLVAHTEAQEHYPLNKDIKPIFAAKRNGDGYDVLEAADAIWAGENKPYSFDRLLVSDADESRHRLLCSAASPKHERLISLLEERTFDHVDIIVPKGRTPRSQLARLAADVARKGLASSTVKELGSDDLKGTLEFIAQRFMDFYLSAGFNVELALTGSKIHAVACAGACAVFKVAQCWNVRPESYDPNRFTIGTGNTKYFLLKMQTIPN